MNKNLLFKLCCTVIAVSFSFVAFAQTPVPDVLYYKFNETGTSVTNLSTNPPTGAEYGNLNGGISQGLAGVCGGSALVGTGATSSTDYVNTGWATDLRGSWTLSFWTSEIGSSSTLFYIFGDAGANSFRCFTNGVAGPNNWILRGGDFPDVTVTGAAVTAPHVTTFVRDSAAEVIYAYLDGILVNTVSTNATGATSTGPFKVCGYATNVGLPANGLMDEFRFYKRALSAAEVALLVYGSPTTDSISHTQCGGTYQTPSGKILTATGLYTDTIINSQSCDSIITINLTINHPTTSLHTPVVCNTYTSPSGKVVTTSGNYMDTIPNSAGCDSIITINLTVNYTDSSTISPVACFSYISPSGKVLTQSANFIDTIPTVNGCDSIITINLTINTVDTTVIQNGFELAANATGATYQWLDCDNNYSILAGDTLSTYTVTANGDYAVQITKNGCADTSACISITNVSVKNLVFESGITLYPNPTNGRVTVLANQPFANATVKVMNLAGQVITQKLNITGTVAELDLSKEAAGIYFVEIADNGNIARIKVEKF